MKQRLVRFDWAMKRLLRNKANFDILEGFLSELLEEDIVILHLLESETNKTDRQDKQNRVDMLAENTKKELLLIEVQNESEHDYLQRILFETSKTLTEHLEAGKSYGEIKKIYSVSIVYFDLGQGKNYVYKGNTKIFGKHYNDLLSLNQRQKKLFGEKEIHELFPEYYIIKVNNFDNIAKNTLDEWIYFLKNEEIKSNFRAKGIQKAKQEFDIMDMDTVERTQYGRYLDDLHYLSSMVHYSEYGIGFKEGTAEAEKKAEKERKILTQKIEAEKEKAKAEKEKAKAEKEALKQQVEAEKEKTTRALQSQEKFFQESIAKKCLENGMNIEQTAQISGLSITEVQKLK